MIHSISIESGVVLPLLRRSRPRTATAAAAARQFDKTSRDGRSIASDQAQAKPARREFHTTPSCVDSERSSPSSSSSSPSLSSGSSADADANTTTTKGSPSAQSAQSEQPATAAAPTRPLKATDPGYEHKSSWVNSIATTAKADLRNSHETRLPHPGAPSSAQGVSRDMSGSAESSKGTGSSTRDGRSQAMPEEDKEFAQLFDSLREKWAKPSSTPSPPESISSRLSFSPFGTPSPRRGVHARQKRAAGQTPKEAATFDAILAGIFANLESSASSTSTSTGSTFGNRNRLRGSGGGGVVSDPYAAARGGGFGLGTGAGVGDRARNLRRWFERDEVDDEVVEELEMLKEEMAVIGDDVELVEWAKNRVFKPLSPIDVTSKKPSDSADKTTDASSAAASSSSTSTNNGAAPFLSFAPTYPKILAHVLRTLRVNYNSPHLVLSLFNYAQTSSLESYLSGCLTGAYNEVLTAKWESFRDFVGVENGIREMEVMGVSWDAATARLVSRIVEEVSKDLLPSLDGFAGAGAGAASGGSKGLDLGLSMAGLNLNLNGNTGESGTGSSGFKNLSTMMGGTTSSFNPSLNWKYGGLMAGSVSNANTNANATANANPNDVLERLGRLEKKVQKDVKMQEKMYENMQRKKRRAREERERRLERESQQGAYDGSVDGVEA
ncbi:hypothetical protein IAU59_003784 [Kwoniella sp. CBS 9459]